jgi:hypothetical protein
MPKPEFPPLLPAGSHVLSEEELFELTVGKFKASSRRKPLWDSLMEFCEDLRDAGIIPCKVWLDGSFLTEKIEPDDIDLIVEADLAVVDGSMAAGCGMAMDIANQAWHVEPRCLHTFLLPAPPVIHVHHGPYLLAKARWQRDWGHALLSRTPKGIALLEVGT